MSSTERPALSLHQPETTPVKPLRVTMVVVNGVEHDIRVLKEAESLIEVGHHLTIIGVGTGKTKKKKLKSGANLVILGSDSYLAPLLRVMGLLRKFRHFLLGFLTCALLFSLVICLRQETSSAVTTMLWTFIWGSLAGGFLLIGLRFIPAVRSLARFCFAGIKSKLMNRAFLEELHNQKPDVVHCHDVHPLIACATYKAQSDCLFVYDSHEIPEHQLNVPRRVQRRCVHHVTRYSPTVDAFITVNDEIADYLTSHYPKLNPATVLMNATKKLSEPLPEYDGRLHEAAGLPRSTRILLFQGGFGKGRGLLALIRSAPMLPDGWALVFMGRGYHEEELRAETSRLAPDAQKKVRFLPMVPQAELAQWTSGASIGSIIYEDLCMNHKLCSPNKLWEYPVAGVPILATDLPVMRRIISEEDTGWLIADPPQPEAVADLLKSIDEEQLARKKENCQRFASTHHWARYSQRLQEVYAQLSQQFVRGKTSPPNSVEEMRRSKAAG